MPLYTITTEAGTLDAAARASLASGITDLHVKMSGVPDKWVHVLFHTYSSGHGFSAGHPAAAVALNLVIRTGRTPDYKQTLLTNLWHLLQAATAAPDDQIAIAIQEVLPSDAMEMGAVMPETHAA